MILNCANLTKAFCCWHIIFSNIWVFSSIIEANSLICFFIIVWAKLHLDPKMLYMNILSCTSSSDFIQSFLLFGGSKSLFWNVLFYQLSSLENILSSGFKSHHQDCQLSLNQLVYHPVTCLLPVENSACTHWDWQFCFLLYLIFIGTNSCSNDFGVKFFIQFQKGNTCSG